MVRLFSYLFAASLFLGSTLLVAQEHPEHDTPAAAAKSAEAHEGAGHQAAGHAATGHAEAGHEGHAEPASGGAPEVPVIWKWLNFGILVLGFGYLILKNAPAFFRSRDEEIQKGMAEAAAIKRESDQKVAAIEARLGSLESEISGLREKSKAEAAAEGARIAKETQAAIAKIQAQSEAEIAAAGKASVADLRSFGAQLALQLAEGKIKGQLNPAADAALVQNFLKGLRN